MKKNIVLMGFMGTGKTSVGKILASKLGCEAVDVDLYIEAAKKRKISEIFEKEGEAYFRVLEKKAVREISQRTGRVITTGGGVVLDPENIETLRENGILITLTAGFETIFNRVKNSKHRPLLQGKDLMAEIQRLYLLRKPLYEKCDFSFPTDDCAPSAVAQRIVEKLKGSLAIEDKG